MSAASHRAGRRYALLVIGAVSLCTLAVGLTNSTVNPWRVTPAPWQAQALDPYRDQTGRLRTGKAGILRSGTWRVALVGSSRVANAFDPDWPGWGRRDVVNLGCNAAFLHETAAIGRYFLTHEPAELILLGIDPGDLTSPVDTRPLFDFGASPFSPDSGLDNELRYLFGLSTLEASQATLKNRRENKPAEYGPKGMRRTPKAQKMSQLKFIASTITTRTELETTDAAGPDRPLNEAKLAGLRAFLEDAKGRGCRVILFFHSNHALMHAEADHIGKGVIPFEKERRLLVDLVAETNARGGPETSLWDFCNYHPLNCEPVPLDDPEKGRMRNWNDLGHFTPEVGAAMLALMTGQPLQHPEWNAIGRELEPENLDSWLREVGAGYQRYLTQDGTRDLAWKEALNTRAKP